MMVDFKELSDSLDGKVRGNPVAISLFKDEIPQLYEQKKVVPCSIVRHAMDKGEIVSFCLLYTSPSPRDYAASRMPSSA